MVAAGLVLPLLGEMVPAGFTYGGNYLVEFEPDSPWFEASLTIAAHALRQGVKTEYHTFRHIPSEIKTALVRLGVNIAKLEQDGLFRVLDTYTLTTGLGTPESPRGTQVPFQVKSFDVKAWSSGIMDVIKEGVSDEEKRWLHLDDDTSVLNQYGDENTFIDIWRTRGIPYARARELVQLPSLLRGAASDAVFVKFESFADGIIDFKSREEKGEMKHYVRVRTIRGGVCDSQWKRLQVRDNGEVRLDRAPVNAEALGLAGWLKGPRK